MKKLQFVIAAPSSGSGKTTFTIGLARYFTQQGFKVQCFKCGPDYLDPVLHSHTTGLPCINLDTIIMSENHVRELFNHYSAKADISIVEGVMGLFDGGSKDKGSTAEIAALLELPVILLMNVKGTAYSIAPLLYGLKNFNNNVNVKGVVFNSVNSVRHFEILKEAALDVSIRSYGFLPSDTAAMIPSRHLGLDTSKERAFEKVAETVAGLIEKNIDMPSFISDVEMEEEHLDEVKSTFNPKAGVLAMAKDEAFSFLYQENVAWLQRRFKVIYFSPLRDIEVPEADVLYLPGGYPELFLNQLNSNKSMLDSILRFCNSGKRVWAECGGFMYLGKEIVSKDGSAYPMVGFFDYSTTMLPSKLHLGYRSISINGLVLKGHEFHYSTLYEDDHVRLTEKFFNIRGEEVPSAVYHKKNVKASYIHLYWGEDETGAGKYLFL